MTNFEIWKYHLDTEITNLDMPVGAEFLHFNVQQGRLCMWIKVSPKNSTAIRRFQLFGTGHEIPADAKYLGTILLNNQALVLHLVERIV